MRAWAFVWVAASMCATPPPQAPQTSVLQGDEIRVCLRDDWAHDPVSSVCRSDEAVLTAEDVLGFEWTTIGEAYRQPDGAPWNKYGALRLTVDGAQRLEKARSHYLLVSICDTTRFYSGPRMHHRTHPVALPMWFTLVEGAEPMLASPRFHDRAATALAEGCEAYRKTWRQPLEKQ